MKKRRWIPYWLRSNDQRCAGCDAPHAHAVEVRCVGCDRPYCPVCVVTVAGEPFCKDCSEGKGRRTRTWPRARSGKA